LDEKEDIYLMDCGEGTAHQLSLSARTDEAHEALYDRLKLIYISHMHADHHLGLCQVLQTWQRYNQKGESGRQSLYLAGPIRLIYWLREYTSIQPDLLDDVIFLNNDTMLPGVTRTSSVDNHLRQAWEKLSVKQMTNVSAKHCFQSFSLILDHKTAGRLVYSGDTRPNAQLVKQGHRARLLIHEATFENDLIEEAKQKRHSTIDEAMIVARDMKAEFVVLTHFSQRYPDGAVMQSRGLNQNVKKPSVAPSSDSSSQSESEETLLKSTEIPVVVAMDLMQIKLSEFWKMPYYKRAIYVAQDESNMLEDSNHED